MTKKHFIALADALRPVSNEMPERVLGAILGFCRDQNPNFNTNRFLGYLYEEMGPSGGKIKTTKTSKKRALFDWDKHAIAYGE